MMLCVLFHGLINVLLPAKKHSTVYTKLYTQYMHTCASFKHATQPAASPQVSEIEAYGIFDH
jgi:hypothetical protein